MSSFADANPSRGDSLQRGGEEAEGGGDPAECARVHGDHSDGHAQPGAAGGLRGPGAGGPAQLAAGVQQPGRLRLHARVLRELRGPVVGRRGAEVLRAVQRVPADRLCQILLGQGVGGQTRGLRPLGAGHSTDSRPDLRHLRDPVPRGQGQVPHVRRWRPAR